MSLFLEATVSLLILEASPGVGWEELEVKENGEPTEVLREKGLETDQSWPAPNMPLQWLCALSVYLFTPDSLLGASSVEGLPPPLYPPQIWAPSGSRQLPITQSPPTTPGPRVH